MGIASIPACDKEAKIFYKVEWKGTPKNVQLLNVQLHNVHLQNVRLQDVQLLDIQLQDVQITKGPVYQTSRLPVTERPVKKRPYYITMSVLVYMYNCPQFFFRTSCINIILSNKTAPALPPTPPPPPSALEASFPTPRTKSSD